MISSFWVRSCWRQNLKSLFVVWLVSQEVLHLWQDGQRQLWKNLWKKREGALLQASLDSFHDPPTAVVGWTLAFLSQSKPCLRRRHHSTQWKRNSSVHAWKCVTGWFKPRQTVRKRASVNGPIVWRLTRILTWIALMFSIICSLLEAPSRTELTPSFLRHHAEEVQSQ